MRVLHVSPYFAPAFRYGGPPRSVLGLCQGLLSAGVDVEVFTTTANGDEELPADVVARGEFEGVPVRYFARSVPRRFFGAAGLRPAMRKAAAEVDLVHVHGLWNVPSWIATTACRSRGVPYVVSPRGMLDDGSLAHHRYRKTVCFWLRERKSLGTACFLHATSTAEQDSLIRLGLGTRVFVVPNGVSTPPREADPGFRSRRGLPANAPLVLFLGRLHPTKRLDLLAAAFDSVVAAFPEAVLVLAGRVDGIDPRSLAGARWGREIRWLGPVEDEEKWELLSEASALVMCSSSESFGMSVLEALSAGVPVVVTRTCPWEEIRTRGCGLWVEQTPESLAEGILALLRDPAVARKMGERGRELVAERYRWPAIGQQMARLYQSALAGAAEDL